MSALDGTWNVSIATPMGAQAVDLTLTTDGATVTGTAKNSGGALGVKDGSVEGDTAKFDVDVTVPMPITLTLTLTATGDAIAGQAKAGAFGSFPVTGTRAA